jgi:hypothetical protein
MRRIKFAWIPAFLLFSGMALGQINLEGIFPHKGMLFPQVAAGGGFESWLTVTNPGSTVYNGDLKFYKGIAEPWNPQVNDTPTTDGTLSISVSSGETKTYKVTSPGSTEAGYAVVAAGDANLTNYIEGHVTYYFSSDALIADSVGVPPAQKFLVSSLPFEDFNSICLALVNFDIAGRPANLKLNVYSDTKVQVGATNNLPLADGEYAAQYLYQLFPDVTLGRGHLEIASDIPVSGMAITQAPGNQFSSLPLNSTTRTYLATVTSPPPNDEMRYITLWSEGFFVKGYMEWREYDTPDWVMYALYGQIADNRLHIHCDGGTWPDNGYFFFIRSDGKFTIGQQAFTGTLYWSLPGKNWVGTGTFGATLVP